LVNIVYGLIDLNKYSLVYIVGVSCINVMFFSVHFSFYVIFVS